MIAGFDLEKIMGFLRVKAKTARKSVSRYHSIVTGLREPKGGSLQLCVWCALEESITL